LEIQRFSQDSNTDSVGRVIWSGGSRYLCRSGAGNIHFWPVRRVDAYIAIGNVGASFIGESPVFGSSHNAAGSMRC
jgi:hypothetical protein